MTTSISAVNTCVNSEEDRNRTCSGLPTAQLSALGVSMDMCGYALRLGAHETGLLLRRGSSDRL